LAGLLAPLTGMPGLPAIGEPLAFAYASHLAVDDDDPEVFESLLRALLGRAAERRLDYLVLGLCANNRLVRVVKSAFRARQYRSCVYLVYWPDGTEAAATVDSRPVHLEVATL
jgi:hypothetical protein